MRKYNPFSKANILSRATSSALAGLPIAYIINVAVFIPIVYVMQGYDWWLIGLIGSIPFFLASIFRMYLIDWVWFKYKVNIDPKYLCIRWYHHVKELF